MRGQHRQLGAAILTAMLTVALVASIAAGAISQQWRLVQVESAERTRQQAQWLLRGALDWARLLLRQDAQAAGSVDHLAEPWALALQPTNLGQFLAAQGSMDASADVSHAFLAGRVEDLQGRINLLNVVYATPAQRPRYAAQIERLFAQLGLPQAQGQALVAALEQSANPDDALRPLPPQTFADLADSAVWGVSPESLAVLEPHVALLPSLTPVNVNTASAIVLQAVLEHADAGKISALAAQHGQRYWKNLEQAAQDFEQRLDSSDFAVGSRYFEALGQVQLDDVALVMRAQLRRDGQQVVVLQLTSQGQRWGDRP